MKLPPPPPEALQASRLAVARIASEIRPRGWLSFARYMELALYAPGMGYYSGGARKFGAAGDFVTAPEVSPLFAQCLALQVQELMGRTSSQIVEIGAGTGSLAGQLLAELDRLGTPPEHYAILDLSGELRARQRETLAASAPRWVDRIQWLDRLPAAHSGVVLGNEVLDAMPCHLVLWTDEGILERGVEVAENGDLRFADRPAAGALLEAARALPVKPPYLSEINLAVRAWVREWGRIVQRGALLLIDYGFPQHEFYHPQRSTGTLRCHYRHLAHDDPFFCPGIQDITAHVDFSAVAEAGLASGMQLLGYCSQAQFLINCGLPRLIEQFDRKDSAANLALAAGVNRLVSPAEMGELFKVICLGREVGEPLVGFLHGDRSHRLLPQETRS